MLVKLEMDYDELKQKKKIELVAIAKGKKLKYANLLVKDHLIRALLIIQKFPTGWEDLSFERFRHWLENLKGFNDDQKYEFENLMFSILILAKKHHSTLRCKHHIPKAFCKICGGTQICIHKKRKEICRICKPSSFCEHDRMKALCKDCHGRSICPHGKQKWFCEPCGGSQICPHSHQKAHCKACRKESKTVFLRCPK